MRDVAIIFTGENMKLSQSCLALIFWACIASPTFAQSYSTSIVDRYRVATNVTYVKEGSWEGKLDIYFRDDPGPHPTLIFIHGGGSMEGAKQDIIFSLLPYLEWGWNVVNVEHRLSGVTLAPAAF